MNKPLNKKAQSILKSVLKYIEKEKRRFNMNTWGIIYSKNSLEQNLPPCRTTACLAGTVLLVTRRGKDFLRETIKTAAQKEDDLYGGTSYFCNSTSFPSGTFDTARKILNLTVIEAERLFFLPKHERDFGWDDNLAKKYEEATTPEAKFKVLKTRVAKFCKTRT